MTLALDMTAAKIPPIDLSTRLRIAREWRGFDQQHVADELGISRASISGYESGRTEPKKLVINAWAVVCDVDVEWLKTGEVPANSPLADYKSGALSSNRSTFDEDHLATVDEIDWAFALRAARAGELVPA